jgi:hypothetical protein
MDAVVGITGALAIFSFLGMLGALGTLVFKKAKKQPTKEYARILLATAVAFAISLIAFAVTESRQISQQTLQQEQDALYEQSSSEAASISASEAASVEAEEAAEEARIASSIAEEEKAEKDPATYATGITYEQIARTPDDFEGEKMQFTGEAIQVMESSTETQIRLAVDGDYDRIIYVGIDSDDLDGKRILEDDVLTVYGTSMGTLTYESTFGGEITIPSMYASIVTNHNVQ